MMTRRAWGPVVFLLLALGCNDDRPSTSSATAGSRAGGGGGGGDSALMGAWSGTWDNDGMHQITFVVDASGSVTSGTLVHPGGMTDQVTGATLTLSGSKVTGNLTFDGPFFHGTSFALSNATYNSGGPLSGTLSPVVPAGGLMSGGGPLSVTKT